MNQRHESNSDFDSFEELFATTRQTLEYWVEGAKNEFTEKTVLRMRELGISKSGLAALLDKKPSQITKLLSGSNNFTIETMVRVALALNCRFHSHLEPVGCQTHWIDVLEGASEAPGVSRDETAVTQDPNADFATAA